MTMYLVDTNDDKVLSEHPNIEGAKLSALRHVQNGNSVFWTDTDGPVQVAACYGWVNLRKRFVVRS